MPAVLKWGTDGLVYFDAVTIEAPAHEVAITEYPIELGANLVDHVRLKPVVMRMTAVVSNSPARTGLTHMDGMLPVGHYAIQVRRPRLDVPVIAQLPTSVAGFPLTRTTTVSAEVRTWAPVEQKIQRAENVYAELRKAMAEAREFTITTSLLGDFDRMLLKGVRTDRDANSGNALKLDMEFQQITYAELSRRDVSDLLPKKPKKARSEAPKDAGKKPAEEADKKTEDISDAAAAVRGVANFVSGFGG